MSNDKKLEFVGLDFETANPEKGSICSIGAVTVHGGKIRGFLSQHVRPKPFEFAKWNRENLGFTEEMFELTPEFPAVWEFLRPMLAGKFVFAHGMAGADLVMLWKCLKEHDLGMCDVNFVCTLEVAQKTWPELSQLSDSKLPTVAKFLKLDSKQHHSAIDDAKTCTQIVLQAAEHHGVNSVSQLVGKLGLNVVRLSEYEGPRTDEWNFENMGPAFGVRIRSDGLGFEMVDRLKPQPVPDWTEKQGRKKVADYEATVEITPDLPLYGKVVVVTGFTGESDQSTKQLVVNLGATLKAGVTGKTDYLVCGDKAGPSKLKKMQQKKDDGKGGEIINESELVAMIPADLC